MIDDDEIEDTLEEWNPFGDLDDLLDDEDDEIDEDDALNYIEDLDDESDPFEEDDEVDDTEPLDKLYDELARNPFRGRIDSDDEEEL
jgi:hypothetical protein